MAAISYFFDTSIFVNSLDRKSKAYGIVFSRHPILKKYTSRHVFKELRRISIGFPDLGISVNDINYLIERIEHACIILPSPTLNDFKHIYIEDKSDRPIVYSAMYVDAILVTADRKLAKDAERYVKTMLLEE